MTAKFEAITAALLKIQALCDVTPRQLAKVTDISKVLNAFGMSVLISQ
jgi:hypothetical protein